MGYGEVGGNDSVQVNVWLRDPELADIDLGGGAAPLDQANAKNPKKLSNKLKNTIRPMVADEALCFVGKDRQGKSSTETNLGDFEVTVRFQHKNELDAAKAAFDAASKAGATEVTFHLKVRKSEAGQIQIQWD
jgi:hypothetical protein